jgi:membrane protein YqaA with SNARE-associated domain
MNLLKRLYIWMIGWAESKYATWALFAFAFVESSFFPIPPDPLLIILALGAVNRAMFYGAVCSVGSVLGALLGYGIGALAFELVGQPIIDFYHAQTLYERFVGVFSGEWGFIWVFTAGFTPIPFKVFTIAAGVAKMNIPLFLLAALVGRSARFLLVAWLLKKFGEPIKEFIDKRFGLLSIVFVVLLVAGFLALKYIF